MCIYDTVFLICTHICTCTEFKSEEFNNRLKKEKQKSRLVVTKINECSTYSDMNNENQAEQYENNLKKITAFNFL